MTPILDGADALADLTRSLDDQIRADAYRGRGASPFQVPEPQYPKLLPSDDRYSLHGGSPCP